jgi:thymidine kinase
MCAKLEIILGNMFSGKSSELIRRLKRHRVIGDKILVVNSSKDTRNVESVLQTHDKETFECIKTNDLLEVTTTQQYQSAKVIAVDEAQFFKNLRFFVEQGMKDDKHVILVGLDGDFRQHVFGELLMMIPLADDVTKLKALCMECMDGTLGPFTKRTVGNTLQELVGDVDIYRAVCRKHLV